LTPAYRELFFEEELANYADELLRDASREPETALEQARLKLGPVLERELVQGQPIARRRRSGRGPDRARR
jgi:hypothetical protein